MLVVFYLKVKQVRLKLSFILLSNFVCSSELKPHKVTSHMKHLCQKKKKMYDYVTINMSGNVYYHGANFKFFKKHIEILVILRFFFF